MADLGGLTPENATPESEADRGKPWYKLLNRYHVFVLVVAALGWLFDCLDQQLFILARPSAMEELVTAADYPELSDKDLGAKRRELGDYATSIFVAGWACGGLIFGWLGDRIGRTKTMLVTILLYSLCTGLSAFAVGVWDFAFYRFLTGLGVGGEFAVGVALVAEVMPTKARPYCLGLLQALSAVGNITAALINLRLGLGDDQGLESSPWRTMFLIGAAPALLAVVVRVWLKEPEKWTQAKLASGGATKSLWTTYGELFADATWRKHAILGLLLGCSGILGLWCVGFYSPDLIREVQRPSVQAELKNEALQVELFEAELRRTQAASQPDSALVADLQAILAQYKDTSAQLDEKVQARKDGMLKAKETRMLAKWQSFTSIAINVGAFLGMFGFGALAQRIGRKPTFVIALLAAFTSTVSVFWFVDSVSKIFIMVPLMGFCQLSLFAGYAIYFPELFPTRLRSTGTSFCYNVGRFVTAFGLLVKPQIDKFFANPENPVEGIRNAGVAMCAVFFIGLFVLPFLPETKDQPLPE